MVSSDDRRALPVFLLTTWTLSSVFYFFMIKSAHSGAGADYVTGLMWCPGAAALLTCRFLRRDVGSLGWKWGETRYQVMSYLIPFGYSVLTYSVVWLTGLGGVKYESAAALSKFLGLGPMPRWAGMILYFALIATLGVVLNCATTLGEEIGWRGFLVPELASRTGFTATAVISGCIWALWHYPIILFAGYNAGTGWYGLTVVTLNMIGLSFVLTWIRLKSGTLWPGVLLHATSNRLIQHFFDPMTTDTGRTKYISGEFGIAFTVVVALLAAYFWSRRGEVSRSEVHAAAGVYSALRA
jgi:membrane protease YdiL (CAAX protease family)